MGLGPRVLISRGGLEKTGLLQPGSRSGRAVDLFKLTAGEKHCECSRSAGEDILPEAAGSLIFARRVRR